LHGVAVNGDVSEDGWIGDPLLKLVVAVFELIEFAVHGREALSYQLSAIGRAGLRAASLELRASLGYSSLLAVDDIEEKRFPQGGNGHFQLRIVRLFGGDLLQPQSRLDHHSSARVGAVT